MSATPQQNGVFIEPSRAALAMRDTILSRDDELQSVLMETVASAGGGGVLESGRTFCPGAQQQVLGPGGRFPRSVSLRECPRGSSGIIHTHVTHGELLSPEHSLPDMANVLLTDLDASIVVGTDSLDVMLAPSDPVDAHAAFERAVGVAVERPRDVVDAIPSRIGDPPAARERVRGALSPLFETYPVDYPGARAEVNALHERNIIAASPSGLDHATACGTHAHVTFSRPTYRARALNRARESADAAQIAAHQTDGGVDVKAEAIGSAIGILAGEAIRWIVFGR